MSKSKSASQPKSTANSPRAASSAAPKRPLYGLIVLLVMGLAAWQSWRWWSWASAPSQPEAPAQATVQLEVASGTSARQIGQQLTAAGLLRSTAAWDLWVKWLALQRKLGRETGDFQAGVYELSPSQSLPSLAQSIREGDVIQARFTVPEGWNIRQMAAYFESQGFFTAQEFIAAAQQIPRDRFVWLPADIPHLEGFLYPDTYQLDYSLMTPGSIVDAMLTQFEQQALPIYQAANTDWSLKDWVAFSSIVEKEAVVPDERNLIAGVLSHRLRIGKKLEVDPTVEYGLGITQTPDQPLTYAEVETPSPYNSYLNPGLPPTPIASPGVASLKAALTPEETDYLFYVARYDGTHVFSRTFEEHLAAQDQIHDARDAQKEQRQATPDVES